MVFVKVSGVYISYKAISASVILLILFAIMMFIITYISILSCDDPMNYKINKTTLLLWRFLNSSSEDNLYLGYILRYCFFFPHSNVFFLNEIEHFGFIHHFVTCVSLIIISHKRIKQGK